MCDVNRVTNVRVSYDLQRANTNNLYRGKPLEVRPIINYVPVNVTFDMYKSDNSLEQMLGLVNTTGVAAAICDTNPWTATYGIRSMQVYYAPNSSSNYNSLADIKSGVLTNYSLQGSINEAMRQSIGMQFLDISGSVNTNPRDMTIYNTEVIKPENINLTGIQFTGCGFSNVTIQSFSLSISFTRIAVTYMGSRFPQSRPLVDVNASLQVQGFIEGLSNTTGLAQYNNGDPVYGQVQLITYPACTNTSPCTITMTNPYVDSVSLEGQAGNFSTFSMSFSLPLGSNPLNTGDGSVLTIQ
jgi:hypothetical protein